MSIVPRFNLRNAKSEAETAIKLFCYFDSKRFVYGTGQKILPHHWSTAKERPTKSSPTFIKRHPAEYEHKKNVRTRLDKMANEGVQYR